MMRSSSASYAFMSDSLLLVLASDRRRRGGENDIVAVEDEMQQARGTWSVQPALRLSPWDVVLAGWDETASIRLYIQILLKQIPRGGRPTEQWYLRVAEKPRQQNKSE